MIPTRDHMIMALVVLKSEERTRKASVEALENARNVRAVSHEVAANLRVQQSCAAVMDLLGAMVDAGGPLTDLARAHVVQALTTQHDMALRCLAICEPQEISGISEQAASIATAIQIVRAGGI